MNFRKFTQQPAGGRSIHIKAKIM